MAIIESFNTFNLPNEQLGIKECVIRPENVNLLLLFWNFMNFLKQFTVPNFVSMLIVFKNLFL